VRRQAVERKAKKCPGFTVRFSDPSACGRSLCNKMLRINSSSLSATTFQPATGHSNQHIFVGLSTLPEPESRYGLSLAHNDAFATIARSMFLACTFVSHIEDFRESVRFPALPLRSVSRPNRGDVNARNPFSAPVLNTPNSSPISTPLQAVFQQPFGSKRSTGSKPGSSSHQTSDCPLLPAASSCDSASDQCLKLAPSELDYRSVNPGTVSIIVKERLRVKRKMIVL
jgi:hypothetical protein